MAIEIRTIETGFGSIAYRVNGHGGLPLLLVHGMGGDSRLFFRQMQFFSRERTVIAVDLPGHGRSAWNALPTMDDYSGAVCRVLEKEGVERVIAVGHSMGGGVVFELFRYRPEWMAAMVFIATGAVLPVSDEVLRFMEDHYGEFCAFLNSFSYAGTTPALIRELGMRELLSRDGGTLKNDMYICGRLDYRPLLASIDRPVLVIANRSDIMMPPGIPEALAKAIPGSELLLLEGDGHLPHFNQPRVTNEAIARFIRERVGAA